MPPNETIDHWDDLVKLGYTMESYAAKGGGRCYAFYRNGKRLSWDGEENYEDSFTAPICHNDMLYLRRTWSNAEWERLQELSE